MLLRTGLSSVVLPILFNVVNTIVTPASTMLFNVVDNYEQCRQHDIAQSFFNCRHMILGCVYNIFANITQPIIIISYQCILGNRFLITPTIFRCPQQVRLQSTVVFTRIVTCSTVIHVTKLTQNLLPFYYYQ